MLITVNKQSQLSFDEGGASPIRHPAIIDKDGGLSAIKTAQPSVFDNRQ